MYTKIPVHGDDVVDLDQEEQYPCQAGRRSDCPAGRPPGLRCTESWRGADFLVSSTTVGQPRAKMARTAMSAAASSNDNPFQNRTGSRSNKGVRVRDR